MFASLPTHKQKKLLFHFFQIMLGYSIVSFSVQDLLVMFYFKVTHLPRILYKDIAFSVCFLVIFQYYLFTKSTLTASIFFQII